MKLPQEMVQQIYETLAACKSEISKLQDQCTAAQKVFTESQQSLEKVLTKQKEYQKLLKELGLQETPYPNNPPPKEWDGEIPDELNANRLEELAGV
jgi:hypothetical protein